MASKKILLKGLPVQKEATAGAILTPGELVEFDVSGDLIPHGTASGHAAKRFVLEESILGNDIDTDYASGDNVIYITGYSGCEVYAWLAAGQTTAVGDPLGSDGAGALAVLTVDATTLDNAIVGYATEVVSSGGSRARVTVELA